MNHQSLTDTQVEQFHRDGFIFVDNLISPQENDLLRTAARADQRMQSQAMLVADTQGRSTNLSLWNHPGDDIYGMIARSHRVVDKMEQLLDGEVYHFHSKLSAKQPRVGGAWEWHQDYGYWYDDGCLYPNLASVMIFIDAATRENGCLEVLTGSHHLGRIEHGRFGEQTGADPQRVSAAKERLEHVYCEVPAGTGIFFHSNLLHCSAANLSEHPRWGLICCYNSAKNDPYKNSHHPRYTPLEKVPDSAILEIGAKGSASEKTFLEQDDDPTTG